MPAKPLKSRLDRLPAAGVYRLKIRLSRPVRIHVGGLGLCEFPAGQYFYCGSAQRNLPARVARHMRKRKPKRWHIDYLTAHPAATVVAVAAWPGGKDGECALVAEAKAGGGFVVVRGFGASDCRSGCGAHLIHLGSQRDD